MRPVELFHIGPQKSGSTWVHRCLAEHPRIATPADHMVHYFDMFHARGRDWYAAQFGQPGPERLLLDPTPTYVRSPLAPRRVAAENPAARIAVTLRHPVDRAFSHFWHEKKKESIAWEFGQVLANYDLFQSWIEPGFYAVHLERWLEHFPREQLLCQRYEDLSADPAGFLAELCGFYGVSGEFEPSLLGKRINVAGPVRGVGAGVLHKVDRVLQKVGVAPGAVVSGRAEYDRGMDPELRAELLALCLPETERLEALLGIDLAAWKV